MGKRLTFEEVKSYIEKEGCKLLSEEYINSNVKLSIKCKCGEIYSVSFHAFKSSNQKQCPKCGRESGNRIKSKNSSFNYEDVKKYIEENNCKLLTKEYKNNVQHLLIQCKCGNTFERTFKEFKRKHKCCPKCSVAKRGVESRKRVKVHCSQCGKEIEKTPSIIKGMNFCNMDCYAEWRSENFKGENNPFYNPNLTSEERELGRNIAGYSEFIKGVFKRDGYKCQRCGSNKNLNAHHLNSYHWYKEGRTDVNNGVTLCSDCHKLFHGIYTRYNNTKEQYEEWISK